MEHKYDKRWILHWSYKLHGEEHPRIHSNTFTQKNEAERMLMGLKHLACRTASFKAKIVQEEVIEVA